MSELSLPTVMVLFGGRSSEHQISCATAAAVLRAIDRERWRVLPVGITPEGEWTLMADDPDLYGLGPEGGYTIRANGSRVSFLTGTPELVEYPGDGAVGQTRSLGSIEVVFPLLHGPYGEDGTLQGMLEMNGIRYVGCGVAASAIVMEKHLTKTVLQAAGLPVGRWQTITSAQWEKDPEAVISSLADLGLPVFIKPCRAGSSMGISRVTEAAQLGSAIKEAQNHDPRVIVEAETIGREIECGVLQYPDGRLLASPLGEIDVLGEGFYDYRTKYFNPEGVKLTCPAEIDESVSDRLRAAAIAAFEAVGAEGLSRIDFFYNDATDEFVINELNTMPGFTPFSMYPRALEMAGVSYPELVELLLSEALGRPLGLR